MIPEETETCVIAQLICRANYEMSAGGTAFATFALLLPLLIRMIILFADTSNAAYTLSRQSPFFHIGR
jgi:cytochrome c oxidase subunit IV